MTPGEVVQARRTELGISRAELARRAEVDPKTLQSLEQDARWPLDVNRARIEAALGWAPGSLDAIKAGGAPSLLVPAHVRQADENDDRSPRHTEIPTPAMDDVLALNQIRSSVRILDQLPGPVQAVVLAQAREHLDAVVGVLDEERVQELVLESYRLLDEQYPPSPTVTSLDGWRSNRAGEDVAPLPYVADSSADEPEMGDDGYHDGP